jgi:tRNA threonylcarbamoyladenosine biosynthesis protein TsaB
MTNILAIETATSSCSVALRINNSVVVFEEVGNNIHSQVLLSMIERLLSQASLAPSELDAVAVGQGPGSFTGLRIGVGVGQGLAYGANCPMIGVSSLDALALQAQGDGVVFAGTDARMGEVYWCGYHKNGAHVSRIGDLKVGAPKTIQVQASMSEVSLVGNAWSEYWGDLHEELLKVSLHQDQVIYPSAGALLLLAEEKYEAQDWVSAIEFSPIYVRNDIAKKSTKPLF